MPFCFKKNQWFTGPIWLIFWVVFLFVQRIFTQADEPSYGISGNPGAVNILTGTGELGDLMKIPKSSGIRLGGLWMGD